MPLKRKILILYGISPSKPLTDDLIAVIYIVINIYISNIPKAFSAF